VYGVAPGERRSSYSDYGLTLAQGSGTEGAWTYCRRRAGIEERE